MAAINKTIMATPTSVRPQWPSQYGQLSNLWSLKHAQLSERPYWPSGYGRLSNCNGHSNMHSYQEGHSGHQDMDSYLTHDQRCTAVCVNKNHSGPPDMDRGWRVPTWVDLTPCVTGSTKQAGTRPRCPFLWNHTAKSDNSQILPSPHSRF